MKTCPICELEISESIPSFCPQCGWDLKNDPTLVPSLDNIPDEFLEDYRQRVEIAKNNWAQKHEAIRRQKELEKEAERFKAVIEKLGRLRHEAVERERSLIGEQTLKSRELEEDVKALQKEKEHLEGKLRTSQTKITAIRREDDEFKPNLVRHFKIIPLFLTRCVVWFGIFGLVPTLIMAFGVQVPAQNNNHTGESIVYFSLYHFYILIFNFIFIKSWFGNYITYLFGGIICLCFLWGCANMIFDVYESYTLFVIFSAALSCALPLGAILTDFEFRFETLKKFFGLDWRH